MTVDYDKLTPERLEKLLDSFDGIRKLRKRQIELTDEMERSLIITFAAKDYREHGEVVGYGFKTPSVDKYQKWSAYARARVPDRQIRGEEARHVCNHLRFKDGFEVELREPIFLANLPIADGFRAWLQGRVPEDQIPPRVQAAWLEAQGLTREEFKENQQRYRDESELYSVRRYGRR